MLCRHGRDHGDVLGHGGVVRARLSARFGAGILIVTSRGKRNAAGRGNHLEHDKSRGALGIGCGGFTDHPLFIVRNGKASHPLILSNWKGYFDVVVGFCLDLTCENLYLWDDFSDWGERGESWRGE